MDNILGILLTTFFLSGTVSTIFIVKIKIELRANDIWTSYVWYWPPSDLKKFKNLIRIVENPIIRQDYKRTYNLFLITFMVTLICLIGLWIYAHTV